MMNDYRRGNNKFSRLFFKAAHGIAWRFWKIPPFKQIRHIYAMHRRDVQYGKMLPEAYLSEAGKPVDPKKIVFLEGRGDRLTDNFSILYDHVKKAGYHVKVCFLHEYDPAYDTRQARLVFAKEAATAAYIFLNDASVDVTSFPMRKETKVIQLWHGCGAFKKFGHSTAEKKFGASEKDREKHHYYAYGNLSLVTVSSPEVAWAYVEAMDLQNKKEIVQATGISRTDVYFDPEFVRGNLEKVHEIFPASKEKKIILFAPTFRGRVAGAMTPDFRTFNLERLCKEFGNEYVVIVKNHPYVGPANTPKIPDSMNGTFAMDLTHTCSIETLLCAADICITDYSSLIFEYSLLLRPMIFYAYDLDDYNGWRGFYYDYSEMTPGPVCRNMDQLTEAIREVSSRVDTDKLEAFRDKFMRSCDGHATERIEKAVFGRSLV